MSYKFKKVDINLIDVHTAVKPIIDSSLLTNTFRFLAVKQLYDQQYKDHKIIDLKSYSVKPMAKRDLRHSYFWDNYITQDDTTNIDEYFDLQIPFIFTPKNFDLKINTENFGFNAKVEPFVYLNSMGWSSQLKISLIAKDENFSSAQLRKFIASLRSKESESPPFILNGAENKRSDIFRRLAKVVSDNIYSKNRKIGNQFSVPYRYFICLKDSSEPPKYYNEVIAKKNAKTSEPDWKNILSLEQQAELLSILQGDVINPTDYNELKKRTLVTRFRGRDFSLTDFDLGTLVFMQDDLVESEKNEGKISCLHSNISNCTTMNLMLLHFQHRGSAFPNKPAQLEKFIERIGYLLNFIPNSYLNRYCISFYTNHGSLKKQAYDENL